MRGRKEAALATMTRRGFWDDESRFAVLSQVEHLDRLEAAMRTAEKLGARLQQHHAHARNGTARELVELLAIRLYVLDRAVAGVDGQVPDDVFVRARPVQAAVSPDTDAFLHDLAEMYRSWAARRGMRVRVLDEGTESVELAVSGLGAGTILRDEAGLHVLERIEELETGDRDVERVAVQIEVVSWPMDADPSAAPLDLLATRAFGTHPSPRRIVRRYRAGTAPLVRDSVRGYRTGRLERVLAGDFDLF